MKNNKKTVYILLPVVVLVWSAIVYQFYMGEGEEPAYQYRQGLLADSLAAVPEKVEYELYLNYPDPFGKVSARVQQPVRNEVSPERQSQEQEFDPMFEEPGFDWNRVIFKGMVEHGGKKNKVALLEMDGKSYMLSKGSEEDGIYVKTLSKDSIEVEIGEESAFIRKR